MKQAAKYRVVVLDEDDKEIGYTIQKMLIRPEGDLAPSKSNAKIGRDVNAIVRRNHRT